MGSNKKKLYKSNANFTLKRIHQNGNYGTIYERDYLTISNTNIIPEGQIPIYSSPTFKLSVRAGFNGQKKYKYGDWIKNPNNAEGDNSWTLDNMPKSKKTNNQIILKSNSNKLTDFVCYGSAYEFVLSSITNIVSNFPGELYVRENMTLKESGILSTIDNTWSDLKNYEDYYIVENPFNIDILQSAIPEDIIYSEIRYFCKSFEKYVVKTSAEDEGVNVTSWNVEGTPDKDCLVNGDLLAIVTINDVIIRCYYYNDNILYISSFKGIRIRPNIEVITDFFNNLNDFEKILLNPQTNYTAIFETYTEDEEYGWKTSLKSYQWPIDEGGWNLNTNGYKFHEYSNSLSDLVITYDELYCDAISRTMAHESIYNMDLTLRKIDENANSSKIKQILNVIGRQFDDIKRYADNIKNNNSITYDQKGNIPDYFLSDVLNISGWETHQILNNIPSEIITKPQYNRSVGYSSNDANYEFLRRLKLNSKNILQKKGTKQSIEDLMAIFGYHSTDWLNKYYGHLSKNRLRKAYVLLEYVYVAKGYSNNIKSEDFLENVKYINSLKDGYILDGLESDDNLDYYQGIPVAEVTFDNKTRLIPWFNKNNTYDNNMYFQMSGGWGRNEGNRVDDVVKYDITNSNVYFIKTKEELYKLPYITINNYKFYYIDNLKEYYKIKDINKHNSEEGWEPASVNEIVEIENIVENNKGNNPHSGNYDGGISYLEKYGYIFRDASFNSARKDETENSDIYGFNIDRQTDTTKCMFYGVDATLFNTPLRNIQKIKPYNFFSDKEEDIYNEEASLSIINSKEFHIIFDDAHRDFIENDILPYLKQIIPSTTIFSYSFEHLEEEGIVYNAKIDKIICDGETCPIYSVI